MLWGIVMSGIRKQVCFHLRAKAAWSFYVVNDGIVATIASLYPAVITRAHEGLPNTSFIPSPMWALLFLGFLVDIPMQSEVTHPVAIFHDRVQIQML